MTATFFWHDYETSGTNPRLDRPTQFAGIRTDAELKVVGQPVTLYCQPPVDVLPQPRACLVTGITPQHARDNGVPEPAFIAQILEELGAPGTCGVGYNSLRFDDEVTRHTAWRNFHPPYEREYLNGCSRWDIIDVVRMCYALRPDGIEWPVREDGAPSFRLEDLALANGLDQARAHDALSDVEATIALARLVRQRQPRLWNYALENRSKGRVQDMLDLAQRTPLLHVSQRIPARWGCLSMIMPLMRHPSNANQIIAYDLRHDPKDLLRLPAEDIQDRLFTPSAELPDDIERIALKGLQVNRCPVLAPLNTLAHARAASLELDVERCLDYRKAILEKIEEVVDKVGAIYAQHEFDPVADPEQSLYGGPFPSPHDKRLCDRIRSLPPPEFDNLELPFQDRRFNDLLFRYRARHFPESLNAAEREEWERWVAKRLVYAPDGGLTLDEFRAEVAELQRNETSPEALAVLIRLQAWAEELEREWLGGESRP